MYQQLSVMSTLTHSYIKRFVYAYSARDILFFDYSVFFKKVTKESEVKLELPDTCDRQFLKGLFIQAQKKNFLISSRFYEIGLFHLTENAGPYLLFMFHHLSLVRFLCIFINKLSYSCMIYPFHSFLFAFVYLSINLSINNFIYIFNG